MTGAAGLHRWSVATALSLGSFAQSLYGTGAAYLAPAGHTRMGFASAVVGAFAGIFSTAALDRRGGSARTRLPWLVASSAGVATATAALPFALFPRGELAPFATACCMSAGAAVVTATARDAAVAVFRPALASGLVERALHPL